MTKKCPKCCNLIRNVAVRCDVCGYVFGTPIPEPKLYPINPVTGKPDPKPPWEF